MIFAREKRGAGDHAWFNLNGGDRFHAVIADAFTDQHAGAEPDR